MPIAPRELLSPSTLPPTPCRVRRSAAWRAEPAICWARPRVPRRNSPLGRRPASAAPAPRGGAAVCAGGARERRGASEREAAAARARRCGRAASPTTRPALANLALPPPVLFVRGRLPGRAGHRDRRLAASRSLRPRSRRRSFARELAAAGLTVVSGFAHGVDAAAHRGALAAPERPDRRCPRLRPRRATTRAGTPRLGDQIAARGRAGQRVPLRLAARAVELPGPQPDHRRAVRRHPGRRGGAALGLAGHRAPGARARARGLRRARPHLRRALARDQHADCATARTLCQHPKDILESLPAAVREPARAAAAVGAAPRVRARTPARAPGARSRELLDAAASPGARSARRSARAPRSIASWARCSSSSSGTGAPPSGAGLRPVRMTSRAVRHGLPAGRPVLICAVPAAPPLRAGIERASGPVPSYPWPRTSSSSKAPRKPARSRSSSGGDYAVEASVGHIRDLAKKNLGIGPGYEPHYVDPAGQEGRGQDAQGRRRRRPTSSTWPPTPTARARRSPGTSPRCWARTPEADPPASPSTRSPRARCCKALENPGKIDLNRVDAQQTRRILDRLMGFRLSPLLWDKVKQGLSAGRVQSVALKMVCDRQAEIDAFVPEEYWVFGARLRGQVPPPVPRASARRSTARRPRSANGEDAGRIEQDAARRPASWSPPSSARNRSSARRRRSSPASSSRRRRAATASRSSARWASRRDSTKARRSASAARSA